PLRVEEHVLSQGQVPILEVARVWILARQRCDARFELLPDLEGVDIEAFAAWHDHELVTQPIGEHFPEPRWDAEAPLRGDRVSVVAPKQLTLSEGNETRPSCTNLHHFMGFHPTRWASYVVPRIVSREKHRIYWQNLSTPPPISSGGFPDRYRRLRIDGETL